MPGRAVRGLVRQRVDEQLVDTMLLVEVQAGVGRVVWLEDVRVVVREQPDLAARRAELLLRRVRVAGSACRRTGPVVGGGRGVVLAHTLDCAAADPGLAIDVAHPIGECGVRVGVVAREARDGGNEPAVRATVEDLDGLVDEPVVGAVAIPVVRPAQGRPGAREEQGGRDERCRRDARRAPMRTRGEPREGHAGCSDPAPAVSRGWRPCPETTSRPCRVPWHDQSGGTGTFIHGGHSIPGDGRHRAPFAASIVGGAPARRGAASRRARHPAAPTCQRGDPKGRARPNGQPNGQALDTGRIAVTINAALYKRALLAPRRGTAAPARSERTP